MKKMKILVLICIVIGFMTGSGLTAEWSAMDSGTTNNLNGLWGSSGSDVFAVGDAGTILHYDGIAWSAVASPTTENLNGIWGSSATDAFAVGDNGTILRYDGSNWLTIPSATTNNLNRVWGNSDSDVFAVGDAGTILHYNGSSWTAMASGTTNSLRGVWGTAGSDVFAVGDSGTILHYNGSIWSSMVSGATENLRAVWGSSSSNVFALGSNGTFLYYNGYNWSAPMAGFFTYNFNGVWVTPSSVFFDVSDGGVIGYFGGSPPGRLMDSGTTENLYDVWGSSGVDVFAVGANGTILHYSIQPPANDNFDNATPITALPFTDTIDTRAAMPTAGDPDFCFNPNNSVWYSFTPSSDIQIVTDTYGSDYCTTLTLVTGSPGNFNRIQCGYSCLTFDALAGETYFFMVGSCNPSGGNLVFNVDVAPPPFTIDLQVDPIGFVKNGITTVSGTLNCSTPGYASIQIQVRQKAGRVFITGYGYAYPNCDGATHWTMQIPGDIGPFLPGKVDVRAIAQGYSYSGCSGEYFETPEVSTEVRLTPQKKKSN